MKTTDIIHIMKETPVSELEDALNAFISEKPIQPHKGVVLGKIRKTDSGYWSSITFPQWVVLEDNPVNKTYRFDCTEDGAFISFADYKPTNPIPGIVRNARLNMGMTQKELGEAVGYEGRNAELIVQSIESGRRSVPYAKLTAFAEALGIGLEELLPR